MRSEPLHTWVVVLCYAKALDRRPRRFSCNLVSRFSFATLLVVRLLVRVAVPKPESKPDLEGRGT